MPSTSISSSFEVCSSILSQVICSRILASGHLIVLTEEGELALVRADPASHQEIVRFPAIEGKTWNHPAMSDGILLIRNIEEMAAFDLRK